MKASKMFSWIIAAAVIAAVTTMGCQRQDDSVIGKLDQIDKRLASLEEAVKQGAVGAARPAPTAPPQRPQGPDPDKVYAVPIEGAPIRGGKNAKVTIVEASTFSCPFCQRVAPTLDQLLADYGDDIRIAYKHFVIHPQAGTIPAHASCAAHKQGKFEPMKNLIWEKGFNAGRNLSQENMETLAKELGLDMNRFKADMEGACKEIVQGDQAQLSRVGTRGTPAFYINGRFLSGAQPIERFKSIIDEELAKANERLAKGDRAETYYQKWVMDKGEKSL
jgi:protein-disulfide isomerase